MRILSDGIVIGRKICDCAAASSSGLNACQSDFERSCTYADTIGTLFDAYVRASAFSSGISGHIDYQVVLYVMH